MFQVGVMAYMRVAVLAAVLILAACGSGPRAQAQSSIRANATPTSTPGEVSSPSPTPLPSASPQGIPSPVAGPLFAVVEGGSGESPDTVAIVGLDGYARAKAKFQPRKAIDGGGNYVPLQGVAQVTGAGVFYIDGFGTVRVLRVGSQPQVVATFPRQPAQYETWFAVSPDSLSVVAGTLQSSDAGSKFSYAIAPAGGQTTVLRQLQNPIPDVITFPVGWIASGPVAMVPLALSTETTWSGGPLYVVDGAGVLSTRLGGADCFSASITPGGWIPCEVGSGFVTVRDTTGKVIWATRAIYPVDAREIYISPDGQAIADGAAASPESPSRVETRAGGLVQVPKGFRVEVGSPGTELEFAL